MSELSDTELAEQLVTIADMFHPDMTEGESAMLDRAATRLRYQSGEESDNTAFQPSKAFAEYLDGKEHVSSARAISSNCVIAVKLSDWPQHNPSQFGEAAEHGWRVGSYTSRGEDHGDILHFVPIEGDV